LRIQRAVKRLTARRASQAMADPLAKRRNNADERFTAHPKGVTQMIRSCVADLEKGAAIPCGLRLDPNHLGGSASVIITWTEY